MRPVEVERVVHFDGELLRSRDLRAQVRSDAERMWWHQRAVHDAVGGVLGLDARLDGAGNAVVSPGIGYDPSGREVVLPAEASIPLPDDPGHTYALVLSLCGPSPPRLAWVRIGRMTRCDGVPIARWSPPAGGVLSAWPGRTRPLARPRFASGATLPGSTAWEPWLSLELTRLGFGIEVRVDTSAVGFSGLPVYLAWLQWPSIDTQDPRIASFSLGLHHIGDETPDGFTFRVAVVVLRRQFARASHSRVDDAILTWARTQRLSVAWIGVDDERDGGAG